LIVCDSINSVIAWDCRFRPALKALYLTIHHPPTKLTLAVDATASTIGIHFFNSEKDPGAD